MNYEDYLLVGECVGRTERYKTIIRAIEWFSLVVALVWWVVSGYRLLALFIVFYFAYPVVKSLWENRS